MLGYRTVMDALYFSGAYRALAPLSRGCGMIYMLHRVLPARENAFQPNALLEVTPEFLEQVIIDNKAAGIEFISLGEAYRRLREGDFARRFAVVTLDDGYRDNLQNAYPIFARHNVPFTVFASSGIASGTCELWWLALERIIDENREVRLSFGDIKETLATDTVADKYAAFARLSKWIACELDEHAQRRAIRDMADGAGLDLEGMCRSLAMDWDELRLLKSKPLATIGGHTLGHHAIARMSEEDARDQIWQDMERHQHELGDIPEYFAFPYGGRTAAGVRDFELVHNLGYKLAVTTRPGQLFPGHRSYLTALPRVSLNGLFQKRRYAELLREGTPLAIYNGFRKINAV
ncbi:polysaccharide deacetylase family protein [Breoghania sp.]|uniref:polysaccharide deacetylase family protein n=1 Tax=Breoghania sp. TaxID=2065378 RepID=UPI002AAB288B|nr:polysaccharide deacetylase family protein [Breoghania sp.]